MSLPSGVRSRKEKKKRYQNKVSTKFHTYTHIRVKKKKKKVTYFFLITFFHSPLRDVKIEKKKTRRENTSK